MKSSCREQKIQAWVMVNESSSSTYLDITQHGGNG